MRSNLFDHLGTTSSSTSTSPSVLDRPSSATWTTSQTEGSGTVDNQGAPGGVCSVARPANAAGTVVDGPMLDPTSSSTSTLRSTLGRSRALTSTTAGTAGSGIVRSLGAPGVESCRHLGLTIGQTRPSTSTLTSKTTLDRESAPKGRISGTRGSGIVPGLGAGGMGSRCGGG